MHTRGYGGVSGEEAERLRNLSCILRMMLWAADELSSGLQDAVAGGQLLQLVQTLAEKNDIAMSDLRVDRRCASRSSSPT